MILKTTSGPAALPATDEEMADAFAFYEAGYINREVVFELGATRIRHPVGEELAWAKRRARELNLP